MRDAWFATKYLQNGPAKRAIGIGVGRAETEIGLLGIGAVEHYDLFDVSPVGLEYAKSCAEKRGFGHKVTTHCMPISEANLPDDTYDLATFVASLHHMDPLEDTLRTVNRCLNKNGMIWCANEYIGPDRFNYPPEQADVARAFFRQIPEKLKNPWIKELTFPTPEEVASVDPTEAPCSSMIEPFMRSMFPRFELTPLYGGFAFVVFWGLNHNALYETPEGAELVRYILAMDMSMTDAGFIPNYFAHIVVRKTTAWQERAMRFGINPSGKLYRGAQNAKAALSSAISVVTRHA